MINTIQVTEQPQQLTEWVAQTPERGRKPLASGTNWVLMVIPSSDEACGRNSRPIRRGVCLMASGCRLRVFDVLESDSSWA